MAMDDVVRFYDRLGSMPELRESLTRVSDARTGEIGVADLIAAARAAGFDASEADFAAYRQAHPSPSPSPLQGALRDADLDAVAGGIGVERADPQKVSMIVQTFPANEYDFVPKR